MKIPRSGFVAAAARALRAIHAAAGIRARNCRRVEPDEARIALSKDESPYSIDFAVTEDKPKLNRYLPQTEEQLRAHTIGELQPLSSPILILDYDPRWPDQFRHEADKMRTALGPRALQVEHVGSTSVPGLAAKPIIDVLLVVANSAHEEAYVPPLERAGYTLRIREPDWYQHRMLKRTAPEVNLHVLSSGCPEIDRMLLFRDWLRINASDRDLYLRTKRALAQKEWKYRQNYADAKTGVIEEILARARFGSL